MVVLLGEGGSDSQSDTSVLATGSSGSKGGRTSPGTVTRRCRCLGRDRIALPTGPLGAFNVKRRVDTIGSGFLANFCCLVAD